MYVTAIIPAKNEEAVIKLMVTMLLTVYPNYIKKVVVVNDGSTDETAKIVAKLVKKDPRVILVNRKPPHGVGLAIQEGLSYVEKQSNYILTLDADFTRNISDLDLFFAKIKNYDGLIGSRYKEKHSLIHYPFFKWISNRVFHFFVRVLLGIQISDLTNNFKLYKKEIFLRIPLTASDYAVNAETGIFPILMGYTIGEIPVIWFARNRTMGVSKFNLLSVAPNYVKVLIHAWNVKKTYPPAQ